MAGIDIEGLSKHYGPTIALRGLDLSVQPGEWVTLLGPSGCGKTTTLRLIAGFVAPTGGRITIGDRVVSDAARRVLIPIERRRLGMVFQAYAVWPHMNVLANVAYPLKLRRLPRGEWRKRAHEALEQVRMAELAERYPHELSGGQQQRIALARALVSRPEVLLLDEPLSALDAQLRVELRSLLATLHRETGLTVIFVTHDQDEAITLSDRVVIMEDGEVRQKGTPREVYHRPANEFVARFVGSGSVLPVRVREQLIYLGDVALGPALKGVDDGEGGSFAGRVEGNSDATGHAGGASILVRPENVRIHAGGRLHCEVVHSWFKGDHELVQLSTPAGELLARCSKRPEQRSVRVDVEEYVQL
jgi:ABC-type Fe3+/spermidine/putrescine transport system ATPase subunit